jgi:hypothetical protein
MKRIVLTTTSLCLNLNGLLKIHQKTGKRTQSCNLPLVTKLILVASRLVSRDGNGRDFSRDDLSPKRLELRKNDN